MDYDILDVQSGLDADGRVRLVVGINRSEVKEQDLMKILASEDGSVIGVVSFDKNNRAFSVKVSSARASHLADKLIANGLVDYVEQDSRVKAFYTPNDPYWSNQWGPQKIEADLAWDTTIGSSDVLVAIVDTGIDYNHADLVANYVPLGHDWINNDDDPMDDNGHGTHCAGIVAAGLNNSVGIAGIAQVGIMAEKVLDSYGYGTEFTVSQGIIHATDCGAKIISMSLGGDQISDVLHDAVIYAYDHGVLLVAAAGNDASSSESYPAAYDEVIAVSATTSTDDIASFSNYGDWIDLAAPGFNIYSTVRGNSYAYMSGTSMACPHVTGVAALAWGVNKNFTSLALRDYLERTADDLGVLGFDEYYGYGRVNARRAAMPVPEHDLSVTEWKCPRRISPGEQGVFRATMSNYGLNNETDISVQFFINETLIDSKLINFLGIGEGATLTFSWNTTVLGSYNLTCYVVPVPGENVTENNAAFAIVRVRFPTVLRVPSEYATVKEALGNALNGDTILVSEGYYAEGQIDILENDISLIADGSVTLDGQNQEYVLNIRANNALVEGFQILNASKYGVYLRGCGNNFTRNSVFNSTDSICLIKSHDSVISLDNATTGYKDVYPWWIFRHCIILESSSNNTVSSNILTGGALWLHYSEDNVLDSNRVTNSDFGLAITTSPNNTLRNNVMTNNTRNFALIKRENSKSVLNYAWQAFNDIDASNTVGGKPIYYWIDRRNESVPSDAGCVVLVQCENITVENLDITNNLDNILLLATNNSRVSNNKVAASTWYPFDDYSAGISALLGSGNLTVTQNEVTACEIGIRIDNNFRNPGDHNVSKNNVIDSELYVECKNGVVISNNLTRSYITVWGSNCTIAFNNITGSSYYGIETGLGANNTVESNNISKCAYGLQLVFATNCTIVANNVVESTQFPAQRYVSSNNLYFHNNFINYTLIRTTEYMSYDVWDNDYPSGGNYWSDYTGADLYKGVYQNEIGSDGIGDTPYILDANNIDNYPLMKPYGDLNDIGITSVTTTKTVVGQGYNLTVSVKILNYDVSTAIFNLTMCANQTIVQTFTNIVLTSRNSVTMTFNWNTTSVAYGNYDLKAIVDTVEGEKNTADNSFIYGVISVVIPGDVNADGIVEMMDFFILSQHYMHSPPDGHMLGTVLYHECYNADVNDDGIIEMMDFYILAQNFMKTSP
jgi:thermitase